jgi:hypothetical protein
MAFPSLLWWLPASLMDSRMSVLARFLANSDQGSTIYVVAGITP